MAKSKQTEPQTDGDPSLSWLWILSGKDDPIYSPQQVCALTGIEKHTLQNWANRGIMKPTRTRAGKGGVRMYTKIQLVLIALARRISPLGVEAAFAVYIAAGIVGELMSGLRPFEGKTRLEVIKKVLCTIAVVTPASKNDFDIDVFDYHDLSSTDYIKATFKQIDPTIIVPCGEIVAKLQVDERKLREASA